MPSISAYVRRWPDEVTLEPVIEVRIEAPRDAPADAMAAAAHAAARVAIVEFSSRRVRPLPPKGPNGTAEAAMPTARVFKDADVQYVIDALIHVGTALAMLHRVTAIEWPDSPREERFEIDHSRESALISSALARLGVNPLSDLPVREIQPDSGFESSNGSTPASGATR